jgi:hypothetical integral membrane protein (TIGR02206 family)
MGMGSHQIYGLSHILWLVGIAAASIVLSVACRRGLLPQGYVRAALICLVAGGELVRYYTDWFHFPNLLPLNLCNITAWIAVIACLTLSPLAVEFTYFAGFVGAGMALLTPDMGSAWHTRFFVNHGALIVAAATLVYGRISPLRKGAIWRAFGLFLVYCGLVGLFDWKYGANYAYLRTKPGTGTVLSLLGPWPFYLLWAAPVAFGLFWLLWLPARPRKEPSHLKESGTRGLQLQTGVLDPAED